MAVAVVVLISALAHLPKFATASSQEVSQETKAALKERDRLSDQAQKLRAAGKTAEAIAAAEKKLAIERKVLPADHEDIVNSLNWLAELRIDQGDWAAAKAARKEVLETLRRRYGAAHWKVTDARLALEEVKTLASLTAEQRRRLAEAERLSEYVVDLYKREKYADAAKSAQSALAIRRAVLGERHHACATSLNSLAYLLRAQGQYGAARPFFERAAAINREVLGERHPEYATSLDNLASLLQQLGDYAAARPLVERALAIRKEVLGERHPEYATSLRNLAIVQSKLGEIAAAQSSYRQVLAIYRTAQPQHQRDIADALDELGGLQRELREDESAKATYQEALSIRRKSLPIDHADLAITLSNLGKAQCNLRQYAAAKASHEEALAILRKALPNDHPDIAQSLGSLGNVQLKMRDYAAAKTSLEAALAIYRRALPRTHTEIALNLDLLGILQHELGNVTAARASHEEAVTIFRTALAADSPQIVPSLNYLGNAQRDLGEYVTARKTLEEAVAVSRKALPPGHPLIGLSLFSLGWLSLASGAADAAVSPLAEAIDLFQADQLKVAVAQSEQEQFAGAALIQGCLHLLIDATISAKANPLPAYDRVVRVKGAVTAQQRWARQARDAAEPGTTGLLDRLRQVSRQLAGLSVEGDPADGVSQSLDTTALMRRLSDERAHLERQLTERSALYRALRTQSRPGGKEIQASLPNGTALIDLVDYLHLATIGNDRSAPAWEQRTAAFVVRPDKETLVVVPLGPSKVLIGLIDRWRANFASGAVPSAGASEPGIELRKRLWEPLAQHLDGVRTVLVSPDGALHGFPWAALPGSKGATFLVQEFAFAVVPVPRLLPELLRGFSKKANDQPTLLLVGGIEFGDGPRRPAEAPAGKRPPIRTFEPLPGSESEVNDIRVLFEDTFPAAAAPDVLRKDKATKGGTTTAAQAHRFVHLATHGFFAAGSEEPTEIMAQRAGLARTGPRLHPEASERHPGLLSGLVFAGVNRPDRQPEETMLTALEAAELQLDNVELITLSACDTGRGRVAGGEGVLGLQRAFQIAGARSVLASLWKMPDRETHELMREFYRRVWSKDPISKAEALRQAQLWMLENSKPRGTLERPTPQGPPSPYYWAAFVLSGDWR
jgi:CHAT domain-containing protein